MAPSTRARRHNILLTAALLLCAILPASAGALRTSAISAAPAESYPQLQPRRHHSALPPAMSPDVMPLLPSSGADDDAAASPSPSDVAEATIPSSPSPPNPDALEPDSAFAPFGYAPAAVAAAQSAAAAAASRAPHVAWALPLGLVAMWLV